MGRNWYGVDLYARLAFTVCMACNISLFLSLLLLFSCAFASPESVVVVYNTKSNGSLQIARHYAEKRGIPETNIIGIECSAKETISWQSFIDNIFNPLREQLVQRGLMTGEIAPETDPEGRYLYTPGSNSVRYLVLCRGMPLRVQNDPARHQHAAEQPPQQQFVTNRASVDSELALLPQSNTPIIGVLPNPLYNNSNPSPDVERSIIRVTRLDGPTAEAAMSLVDRALLAEQTGLLGRAYVDIGGRHPRGDEWLKAVAKGLENIGYDTSVESSPNLFGEYDRFDAPAIYFGWYADHATGPMMADGFEFVPGALGFHIHSFSADTLRSGTRRWAGPLVARGMTATVGNVWEPFLEFTHNPVLLVRGLVEGKTFGEAATFALPCLSWQAVVIGDPLYRPMKVSIEQQLQQAEADPNPLSPYAVIRAMNLLRNKGDTARAMILGRQGLARFGGMPLAISLAQLQFDGGATSEAILTLQSQLPAADTMTRADIPLAHAAAKLLADNNCNAEALAIVRRLLEYPDLPRPAMIRFLGDAFSYARNSGDSALATNYSTRLAALKAEELAETTAKKQ